MKDIKIYDIDTVHMVEPRKGSTVIKMVTVEDVAKLLNVLQGNERVLSDGFRRAINLIKTSLYNSAIKPRTLTQDSNSSDRRKRND